MISENSLLRRATFPDVLFLKKLYEVTTDREISKIINMLDDPKITNEERQIVELFFLKVRNQYETWFETILGLTENFDFDVSLLLKNTFLLDKLRAERVTGMADMSEFF